MTDPFVTHALGTDWYALFVYDLASATERRMFGSSSSDGEPVLILANGNRIVTQLGSTLAVWCR